MEHRDFRLRRDFLFWGAAMGTPFMSEVKIIAWNFPPKGWAFCNGQFLPINQNQALFSLLGTMYGGNGQTTFALPDMRGRAPIHQGAGFTIGQVGGEVAHTLTMSEMPAHNHFVQAQPGLGGQLPPVGAFLSQASNVYRTLDNLTTLHPATIANVGGSQPHQNLQPYLVVNYIIALLGVFPSRN
jgi:microcystin-dependent protein